MIYLVEDDNSIRELVTYTLNSSGLDTAGFDKPSDFWKAMKSTVPSLIILDIMLPEESGLSILKKIRASADTRRIPVMMLTAKSTEYDKVVGLDSGADDYVAKPFGMMELLSRVKALIRRVSNSDEDIEYKVGELYLNTCQHVVRVKGENVTLTLKEYELLSLLMKNRGIVFDRDRLLNTIWGYSFDGENRTVDVHIRTLRHKLGECGDYIETVRGVGYKFGSEIK